MTNEFKDYQWYQDLENRQQKEVDFAKMYADNFTHGTDGHHRLILIADMAEQLSVYETKLSKSEKISE